LPLYQTIELKEASDEKLNGNSRSGFLAVTFTGIFVSGTGNPGSTMKLIVIHPLPC